MQRSGPGEDASSRSDGDVDDAGGRPDEADSGTGAFDWRGWALVAAIVVAFLVVPATILYLPAAQGVIRSLGLTMRDAYLVLPLLPAFGLGLVAVWSAIRSRSS